jgi:hypothetical protein
MNVDSVNMLIRKVETPFRAAVVERLEVTIMLDPKLLKIQALGLFFVSSFQLFVTAPVLAEDIKDANVSATKEKIEAPARLAMKPVVVERQVTEEPAVIDPALERKLRKEMSSYVADQTISVF